VDRFDEADVRVCGYGVAELRSGDAVDRLLEVVDRLSGEYLSATFPPDDDELIRELITAGDERDVDVAVHNHGPEST
jgi:uncharacterized membrane protein